MSHIWVAVGYQEHKAGCTHVLYIINRLVDLWLLGIWELCPLRGICNLCYISFGLGVRENRCCSKAVLHIIHVEASYLALCSKGEELPGQERVDGMMIGVNSGVLLSS